MGRFDGALKGGGIKSLHLFHEVREIMDENDIRLCRDDGLINLRNCKRHSENQKNNHKNNKKQYDIRHRHNNKLK